MGLRYTTEIPRHDASSIFEINGIRCGTLICYDVRFFELYREYVKRGVKLIFHCFNQAGTKDPGGGLLRVITVPTIQALAAANHVFVVAPNSSTRNQEWPGIVVTPDGRIAGRNRLNSAGMILNTVDLKVTETAPEIKGATATNQYKPATMETGLIIQVPPFIKVGELLRVDTRTGEYVTRVKE